MAGMVAVGEHPTQEAISSIFSCLLCAACLQYCPQRIDIVDVLRSTRAMVLSGDGDRATPGSAGQPLYAPLSSVKA